MVTKHENVKRVEGHITQDGGHEDRHSTQDGGRQLLAGAAKAASYNMVLQLMLRVMTFGLNAFVLRYISRDMLGVVNVRLTLLYSTTVFMTTDALQKACLSRQDKPHWPHIVNLMWCTVPGSIVVACTLGWLWVQVLEPPDPALVPSYNLGVICWVLSSVCVMMSEPLFVVGQKCLFLRLKVLSTGIAELCKCVLTVILVVFKPEWGLVNFAIAQVVYGVVIPSVYYVYFFYYMNSRGKKDDNFPFKSLRDFLPSKLGSQTLFDPEQTKLALSIFKQSFLKQLLTEGEKYVMTIFGVLSFADQGIYDVVNNLGSMAARFIFLPIEESGYLFFSQLLTRGKPEHQQKQESIRLATEVLSCLLKLVMLTGTIILVFGYAYSHLALDLYGGHILSTGSGPMLLRWFSLYVLVIAVNGITECFVFATMSKDEVDRYNRKMLLFSAAFLLSSLGLTRQFGSVGFILANCVNMSLRIAHSVYYIRQYFSRSKHRPFEGVVPSVYVIITFIISFIITVLSERVFCCEGGVVYRLIHIAMGGVCLLVVMATIYIKETTVVQFIKDQYKSRHKQD